MLKNSNIKEKQPSMTKLAESPNILTPALFSRNRSSLFIPPSSNRMYSTANVLNQTNEWPYSNRSFYDPKHLKAVRGDLTDKELAIHHGKLARDKYRDLKGNALSPYDASSTKMLEKYRQNPEYLVPSNIEPKLQKDEIEPYLEYLLKKRKENEILKDKLENDKEEPHFEIIKGKTGYAPRPKDKDVWPKDVYWGLNKANANAPVATKEKFGIRYKNPSIKAAIKSEAAKRKTMRKKRAHEYKEPNYMKHSNPIIDPTVAEYLDQLGIKTPLMGSTTTKQGVEFGNWRKEKAKASKKGNIKTKKTKQNKKQKKVRIIQPDVSRCCDGNGCGYCGNYVSELYERILRERAELEAQRSAAQLDVV